MEMHKIAAEQRLMLERTFAQAQAYTNLVMLAGYAGLFALWKTSEKFVTPLTAFITGVFFALSLAIFVGWEIYAMQNRAKGIMQIARAADDPDRFLQNIANYQTNAANIATRLAKVQPYILFSALGTGGVAAATLFSAFCHGIWLQFGGNISSQEKVMVATFMWLALGAAFACVLGVVAGSYIQGMSERRRRTGLARSLADELRTSADLYSAVQPHWEKHGFVLFLHLDEIIESRVDYQNARPFLPLIPDPNLRSRISSYYRKSIVTMEQIRSAEKERARLKGLLSQAPEELENAKGTGSEEKLATAVAKAEKDLQSEIDSIVSSLEELDQHRLEAMAIAEKLEHV